MLSDKRIPPSPNQSKASSKLMRIIPCINDSILLKDLVRTNKPC